MWPWNIDATDYLGVSHQALFTRKVIKMRKRNTATAMIPVSQLGRVCSAFSKRDTIKLYVKIPKTIENLTLNAWWLFFSKICKGCSYLLEPQRVPVWAEASEAQRLVSPCLFLCRFAKMCLNVKRSDLYPCFSLTRKQLSEIQWKKKTTPNGPYRSSQSFTHCIAKG